MEISLDKQDTIEISKLTYVFERSLFQIFNCFDRSPGVFLSLVDGDVGNPNNPGLPLMFEFNHIEELTCDVTRLPKFVVIFRHYARELYNQVLMFANMDQFQPYDFHYMDYLINGTGLRFALSKRKVTYVF